MNYNSNFYINGEWVKPSGATTLDIINPATEQAFTQIAMGTGEDVDRAVSAAKAAFTSFSQSSREQRMALLGRIIECYQERLEDFATAISLEMGAPRSTATQAQAPSGIGHFVATLKALEHHQEFEDLGSTRVFREPIGVVGMITPWNWPINQIACKVAPAIATGCTIVLKPSEIAPLSAIILAEVLDKAGVPAGVFNMVHGDGPTVGSRISSHPDIDMVSFTGSTRAGVLVSQSAAPTVKRVSLELGGKSANIILDDANLEQVIPRDIFALMYNSGQSCNAPTRMLVPRKLQDQVVAIAKATAEQVQTGAPDDEHTFMGPVASGPHWHKVQGLIKQGIDEGAVLVTGGTGRPEGLDTGFYVRPTIFANVSNDMTIAREEIFGPVLCIIPYDSDDHAVAIANDTPYGLSGYISSDNLDRARAIAARIRTGMIHLNGASVDYNAPFGGYKQSGNGREWGKFGLEDYLEVKAVMGYNPA